MTTPQDALLSYQKKYIEDDAKVRMVEKSRRIGLTWADAAESVLTAAAEHGMNVFYISYNMEFTKEYITTCAWWARAFGYAATEMEEVILKDEDKDVTAYQIRFDSSHKILGLPSRATTLRGRQGKVVIDEAAFVEDLQKIMKAALALLMWGGRVSIISTHNGEDSYFNDLVQDVRKGRLPYSLHKYDINTALSAGLYQRICEIRDEEWSQDKQDSWLDELVREYGEGAAEELHCIPSRSGEKYFPRALVEACMDISLPVVEYRQDDAFTYRDSALRERVTKEWLEEHVGETLGKVDEGLFTYCGMDFARSGDLSVLWVFQEEMDLSLRSVIAIQMRKIPFMNQLQVLRYVVDRLTRFGGGAIDARGNGQQIAEMAAQEYGAGVIHEVMIARNFYAEYFPRWKARYEDRTVAIPKHSGLMDDHRVVVLDKGVPIIAERTGGKDERRHGDGAVAGALVEYAVQNSDKGYHPYTYEAVVESTRWG